MAVVALPLAMALAIASGTTPDRGLFTAVIAGFLISALGGSRLQIGGPTGAFVVVVFATIERHGYDGLLLATLLAGAMLILLGLARLGTIIKYIPYPVVTGFTSGIAVIIFTSQIKEFLGLELDSVPADFVAKIAAIGGALPTLDPATCGIGLGTLILDPAPAPSAPAAAGVPDRGGRRLARGLGQRSRGRDHRQPVRRHPAHSARAERAGDQPGAASGGAAGRIHDRAAGGDRIASLRGHRRRPGRHAPSLQLRAGRAGRRQYRLALFGGLPATGAIARTATNIRSGARTPIAGMLHALFLLLFMLLLAPLANGFPLASLAAVLIVVAWTMGEAEHFTHLLRAPRGDRLVLLLTFGLTVLVDITVAVNVGVVLAALLFMQRMSAITEVQSHRHLIEEDLADLPRTADRQLTLGAGRARGGGDLPHQRAVLLRRGLAIEGCARPHRLHPAYVHPRSRGGAVRRCHRRACAVPVRSRRPAQGRNPDPLRGAAGDAQGAAPRRPRAP